MPPNYSRQQSNDLAASVRIAELRQLQTQLSSVIQDENDEASVHSNASLCLDDVESGLAPISQRQSRSLSKERTQTTTSDAIDALSAMPRFASRRASNDLGASDRIL